MEGTLTDKNIVCKTCGEEFIFTVGEQEFYAENNLQNEPKNCKACRDARKSRRPKYSGVCAECGQEALVPFPPRTGEPVYCSECFAQRKEAGIS